MIKVQEEFRSNLKYSDKIFLFNIICDHIFHNKDIRNRLKIFVETRFSPIKFEIYEWLIGEFEENNHNLEKWEEWIRNNIDSEFAERFRRKSKLYDLIKLA